MNYEELINNIEKAYSKKESYYASQFSEGMIYALEQTKTITEEEVIAARAKNLSCYKAEILKKWGVDYTGTYKLAFDVKFYD
jgi:hypothetical protein